MALADNELDDRERKMLQQVARRRRIPDQQLEALIQAAMHGQLEAPQPADTGQARQWLVAMADMSLSDGRIDKSEYELLCRAGAQLNMTEYDIQRLLRQRRTHLYKTARQRIRDAKR